MRRRVTSIITAALVLTSLVFSNGCKHEPVYPIGQEPGTGGNGNGGGGGNGNGQPCDPNTIYFVNDILPIFQSNCAMSGCHDANSAQDGIVLTSYSTIMGSDVIEPGNANDSEVYEVITETDPDKIMPQPPQSPLTQAQISMIQQWINQGAPNNSCTETACDTFNVTFSASVKPIITGNCQGCHSGGNPSGGIDLSTYAGVQAVASSGQLYGAVNHQSGYQPMPQGGNKLPFCEIRKIKLWIDAGAPNN